MCPHVHIAQRTRSLGGPYTPLESGSPTSQTLQLSLTICICGLRFTPGRQEPPTRDAGAPVARKEVYCLRLPAELVGGPTDDQ